MFCVNGYNMPKPGFSFLTSKCQVILSVATGTGTRLFSHLGSRPTHKMGCLGQVRVHVHDMHQATLAGFTNLGMLRACKSHREVFF